MKRGGKTQTKKALRAFMRGTIKRSLYQKCPKCHKLSKCMKSSGYCLFCGYIERLDKGRKKNAAN